MDNAKEAERMTDKQSKRDELLTRIDELNRMEDHTAEPATLEYIKERKKALRSALETL